MAENLRLGMVIYRDGYIFTGCFSEVLCRGLLRVVDGD